MIHEPTGHDVRRGHEPRDASVKGIVWFAVGIAFAALLLHLVIAWLYQSWARELPGTIPAQLAEPPQPPKATPALETNNFASREPHRMGKELTPARELQINKAMREVVEAAETRATEARP